MSDFLPKDCIHYRTLGVRRDATTTELREAYLRLYAERTSAEERRDLNNTKILFKDPEVRKKYDAFLVRRGLPDGIVGGFVEVVDGGGAGGLTEAGNNLPQGVETAPVD